MVKLQRMSVKQALSSLLKLYQDNKMEDEFARLIYKHNIYIPRALYLSIMDYNIESSIEDHNEQLDNFIITIREVQNMAMSLSGARNIFNYSSDTLLDKIVNEMDTHRLCCFFIEAIKVLNDKMIYIENNYEQVVRDLQGIMENNQDIKQLRCDVTEQEIQVLELE